eukprot:TRINITY_DN6143_c0_g2_i1.p1 TRINITY_DN6143_c0_g2~~TRINITY_DN6143_c0_g2_i1.p1  ORF type:complete len:603 (-),score=53.42 TRINITY_DN6143_c0_g2_i1:342-2150(-)
MGKPYFNLITAYYTQRGGTVWLAVLVNWKYLCFALLGGSIAGLIWAIKRYRAVRCTALVAFSWGVAIAYIVVEGVPILGVYKLLSGVREIRTTTTTTTTTTMVRDCDGCSECIQRHCKYQGDSIRILQWIHRPAACQAACQIDRDCQHWSYGKDHTCNLLRTVHGSQHDASQDNVAGPKWCEEVPRSMPLAPFTISSRCSLYGADEHLTARSSEFLQAPGSVGNFIEKLEPILLAGIGNELRDFLTSAEQGRPGFTIELGTLCSGELSAPPSPWWEQKWFTSCSAAHGSWGVKFAAEALLPHALLRSPWLHASPNQRANLTIPVIFGLCNNWEVQYPKCMQVLRKRNEGFRQNPRKTYFILSSDRGRCGNGDSIHHDWNWMDLESYRRQPQISMHGETNSECFDASMDVVIPCTSFTAIHRQGVQLMNAALGTKIMHNRSRLGFMAVGVRYRMREKLARVFENDPDILVPDKDKYLDYQEVVALMQTAKFCLQADGNAPWSPRLVEYIVIGCVPVMVSDRLVPPFHRTLNWSMFSVRLSEKEAVQPGLLKRLLQHLVATGRYDDMSSKLAMARESMLYHPGDWLRGSLPLTVFELFNVNRGR